MEKIPSLFERDWSGNRALVTRTVAVELPPDAIATRKWDGTAVLIEDGKMFKRYTLKARKPPPEGFRPCGEPDEKTGKQPGWVPVGAGPEDRYYREFTVAGYCGTYELVGDKINSNKERAPSFGPEDRCFMPHGAYVLADCPRSYDGLKEYMNRPCIRYEGIVWWHDGKPVAKIKRTDFGLPWPITQDKGE